MACWELSVNDRILELRIKATGVIIGIVYYLFCVVYVCVCARVCICVSLCVFTHAYGCIVVIGSYELPDICVAAKNGT